MAIFETPCLCWSTRQERFFCCYRRFRLPCRDSSKNRSFEEQPASCQRFQGFPNHPSAQQERNWDFERVSWSKMQLLGLDVFFFLAVFFPRYFSTREPPSHQKRWKQSQTYPISPSIGGFLVSGQLLVCQGYFLAFPHSKRTMKQLNTTRSKPPKTISPCKRQKPTQPL